MPIIKKYTSSIQFLCTFSFLMVFFSTIVFAEDKIVLSDNIDYLRMSREAYEFNQGDEGEISSTGAVVAEVYDDPSSGFSATVFRKPDGSVVVSFRGTEVHDFKDILTDKNILRLGGAEEVQYRRVRQTMDAVRQKYGTVSVTGHSLGGSLAQYASLYSGLTAVTFNTAPITTNQDALSYIIRQSGLYQSGTSPFLNATTNITNISTSGDPMTLFNEFLEAVDSGQDPLISYAAFRRSVEPGYITPSSFVDKARARAAALALVVSVKAVNGIGPIPLRNVIIGNRVRLNVYLGHGVSDLENYFDQISDPTPGQSFTNNSISPIFSNSYFDFTKIGQYQLRLQPIYTNPNSSFPGSTLPVYGSINGSIELGSSFTNDPVMPHFAVNPNADLTDEQIAALIANNNPADLIKPEEPAGLTPEEIAEAERVAEEQRLARIANLRAQRNTYSLTQQDAHARLQERNNRLTVLQFDEREQVQTAVAVVRNRISRLRIEHDDAGLSAADQQLLLDLVRYEDRLQAEQVRIAQDITSAQNAISAYQTALNQANSQLTSNANNLVNLGDNLSDYSPPTFIPEGLTDWTTYEYNLPSFNGTEVPISDIISVVVSTVSLPVTSGTIRKTGAFLSEDGNSILYDVWGVDEARSQKLEGFNHLYYGTGTDGLQWIYGQAATPEQYALRTGTATFNGGLSGYYAHGSFDTNTVYQDSVRGELALSIDFGSNRLTGDGRLEIDNAARTETLSFSLNEAVITETGGLTHSFGFNTNAKLTNGASGNGNFSGTFYGADTSEAAGSFAFGLSGGFAAGVWAAGENYAPGDGSEESGYSGAFVLGYAATSNGYGSAWRDVNDIYDGEITLSGGQSGDDGTVDIATTFSSNGYSHVSWGTWLANDTTSDPFDGYNTGYWVDVDSVTASSVLENRTGSAQFAGEIRGGYVGIGNVEEDVRGLINITANFADQSVGGQFQFGRSCSGASLSGCSIASEVQSFNGPIDNYDGRGFGNYGRVGNSGVVGVFGGENGQEIGGHAWLEENQGQYVGVFRAREGLSFGDFVTPSSNEPPSTNYSNYRGLGAFVVPRTPVTPSGRLFFATITDYSVSNDNTEVLSTIRLEQNGGKNTSIIVPHNGANNGYDYTDWGSFDEDDIGNFASSSSVDSGLWVAYEPTTDLRTTGSASYSGTVDGQISGGEAVSGTINLNADFANDQIYGNMDLSNTSGNWADASFDTTIRRDSDSSGFQGALTGTDVNSGIIFGGFAGPNAEEIGGGWQIDNANGSNANGIFRAQN